MALTEEKRLQLHKRLEEVLGTEQAAILMEHLPPAGWADVAMKRDLDLLKNELELRIDASANGIRAEFQRDLRMQAFTLLAGFAAVNSLAVAAVRFL